MTIPGSPRARTPEQVDAALAAGWLVMGDAELYSAEELPGLVRAARWAVARGLGAPEMRRRFARPAPLAPAWTVLATDRDGRPTLRCWRLPRLVWPGLAVWAERGRYSIMSELPGRCGTYAPTGFEARTLGGLRTHLETLRETPI
jgi:hypothetical protein